MKKVICPGSFDPVTNGHMDIFKRAADMFDEIIVAVFHNPGKQKSMFTMQERMEMLRDCTKDIKNISVDSFSGMLHEYLAQQGASVILRGLRALTDFEYEFQRALMIKKLSPNIETIFMMTNMEYSYLSSTGVRELLAFGGCVKGLVPESIEKRLGDKATELLNR